jgi:hypothetical protein
VKGVNVMHDLMREMLRRADRASQTPALRSDVAEGVRRKVRKQRLTRGIATGAMGVMIAVGILEMTAWQERPPAVTMVRPPPVQKPLLDETDVKVVIMTADLVENYEKRPPTSGSGADAAVAQEYLWQVAEAPNQTALILVRSADRIYRQSHDRPAAEASYRQAIRLFPDSPAAAVARERLRNLGDKGKES